MRNRLPACLGVSVLLALPAPASAAPGAWPAPVLAPGSISAGTAAASPAGGEPTARRGEWLALSRRLARPWPRLQRADGTFRDALGPDGTSRYGEAMLGLALLQTGLRDRNRGLVRTATRALDAVTRQVDGWFATRPFEVWAVAGAYNLAVDEPSLRGPVTRWAAWLRRQHATYRRETPEFDNKRLVDALAIVELARTGLSSEIPGTVLGPGGDEALQRALRLLERRLPRLVPAPGAVLSDTPDFPPAYHALSHAVYARAVARLGPGPSRRARRPLEALARTVWLAAAPDGDLAYWGRSAGQSWTLAAGAYGLAATARITGEPWRERYLGLAARLLRRLEAYGVGRHGEWITPSLRQNGRLGRAGLDGYARATEYAGLTLAFLNLAIPLLGAQQELGRIPADGPLRAVLGQGIGSYTVVRQGNVWFATHEYGGTNLRYDFGPLAVKRLEDGRWRDVLPWRPIGPGTAGPVLVRGGVRAAAVGWGSRVGEDGRVEITGGFRTRAGTLVRRATFAVRPVACGVELVVPARRGDGFELSPFLRARAEGRLLGARYVRGDRQLIAFSPAFTRGRLAPNVASASDAFLSRGRFLVPIRRERALRVTFC